MLQHTRKGADYPQLLEITGDAFFLPITKPCRFGPVAAVNLDRQLL